MRPTVTVGTFLARRLQQLGIAHLFGLPGDSDLALLGEVLASGGPQRVGSSDELIPRRRRPGRCPPTGYADGHARLRRGPAAFATTFGVGELSAVNVLAGSCVEDVPSCSSWAALRAVADGALLHHSLADGTRP